MSDSESIHIVKYLARSGVGSRQACERLVDEGKVTVNGEPCVPGQRVQLETDTIEVEGRRVEQAAIEAYLVHKPTEMSSEEAARHLPTRKYRDDLVPALPVAAESDGAIIALSDTALAAALQGPTCCIERAFVVSVRRNVSKETIARLNQGIPIEDGEVSVRLGLRVLHEGLDTTLLRVKVDERHRKYMRHVLQHVGHTVLEIHSVGIGPITLDDLPKSKARPLSQSEIEWLQRAAHTKVTPLDLLQRPAR